MASGVSGKGGIIKKVTGAGDKKSAAPRPKGVQKGVKEKKGVERKVTAGGMENEDTVLLG